MCGAIVAGKMLPFKLLVCLLQRRLRVSHVVAKFIDLPLRLTQLLGLVFKRILQFVKALFLLLVPLRQIS